MTKITRTCSDCNKLLRKADAWETIEKPVSRLLCPSCWYKLVGLNNPKEYKDGSN